MQGVGPLAMNWLTKAGPFWTAVLVFTFVTAIGYFWLIHYQKRSGHAYKPDDQREDRKIFVQWLAGTALLAGALGTLLATFQSNQASERLQVAERYANAAELLAGESPSTRVAGISELRTIMEESPEYHWRVVRLLAAYVREHARAPEQSQVARLLTARFAYYDEIKPDIDVQEAITAIGTRWWAFPVEQREQERVRRESIPEGDEPPTTRTADAFYHIDLRGVDLRGADLKSCDLRGALLQGALLDGTQLWDADLEGADLRGASLLFARAHNAELPDANWKDACVCFAQFNGTNLDWDKARVDKRTWKRITRSQLTVVWSLDSAPREPGDRQVVLPAELRAQRSEIKEEVASFRALSADFFGSKVDELPSGVDCGCGAD